MRSGTLRSFNFSALVLAAMLTPALPAFAQVADDDQPAASPIDANELLRERGEDSASEVAKRLRAQQETRKKSEKELRQIRMKHFGTIKKTEIRQEGIAKMRQHTDPALFPLMIDLYSREGEDVRDAVMQLFIDSNSREGDTSLAWLAVYGRDEVLRMKATKLLDKRIKEAHPPAPKPSQDTSKPADASSTPATDASQPQRTLPESFTFDPQDAARIVIYEGLRRGKDETKYRAANLAADLNMTELIPWLAASQASGRPQGAAVGGLGSTGALAYIIVGTQQSFVSDLTPVVSENAVAFDPQLSTVTSGTVLRVIDAVVYTYHVDIHNALVRLANNATNKDMGYLGWDYRAWMNWYKNEYLPTVPKSPR
ncbi:MAG: hypothetical protein U0640_00200 [Phycisphaerales bacterium]